MYVIKCNANYQYKYLKGSVVKGVIFEFELPIDGFFGGDYNPFLCKFSC